MMMMMMMMMMMRMRMMRMMRMISWEDIDSERRKMPQKMLRGHFALK
jgi:hypothetical protein